MAVDFEELVAARGQALLRFAVMLCGDRDRAEDLVQSVLAKAYRRWSRVAAADRPEAYLKAMVVNEHLGWWRRRSNRELPHAVDGPEPMLADGTAARASRDAAWTLLATLSRRQRAVLVRGADLGAAGAGRAAAGRRRRHLRAAPSRPEPRARGRGPHALSAASGAQ